MASTPLKNGSQTLKKPRIPNDESPIHNENTLLSWDDIASSPGGSTCSSPDFHSRSWSCVGSSSEGRRGRPRAEALSNLMLEGSTSPSTIKCIYCNRVFPRDKSLQAHLRIHRGERPYACDYPGCTRAFTQSGQLRTHQRLHTGEKPFLCSFSGCGARFTHSNRHCVDHPGYALIKCATNENNSENIIPLSPSASHSPEEMRWLEKYHRDKDRSPSARICPVIRKRNSHQSPKINDIENQRPEEQNEPITPSHKQIVLENISNKYNSNSRFRTPKRKMCENRDYHGSMMSGRNVEIVSPDGSTPRRVHSEQPKKRWLREAFQDAKLWSDNDKNTENLAQPINWGNDEVLSRGCDENGMPREATPTKRVSTISSTNNGQQRPTVLTCISSNPQRTVLGAVNVNTTSSTSSPSQTTDPKQLMGAIALIELAAVRPVDQTGSFNYDIY